MDGPQIVVFGGSGYLGQAICHECVNRGVRVYSVSRHGHPSPSSFASSASSSWLSKVQWLRGDISNANEFDSKLQSILAQSSAVIDAIGGFGSVDHMKKVNGEWNVNLILQCKNLGVPRFVYVSAHHYPLPALLQKGYFEGKKAAEKALTEAYGRDGVILRPSSISGVRTVKLPLTGTSVPVPLNFLLTPHSWFCRLPPVSAVAKFIHPIPLVGALSELVLTPSVSVEGVANAAVCAALDSKVCGILDVAAILSYEKATHMRKMKP